MARKRIQVELGPAEALALERVRGLGSTDAEVGRQAILLLGRLAGAVGDGFTIAAVPEGESRFPDAAPELTDAIAPERRYAHLVRLRHPWRRQLSLKGRRMTVGQLVWQMRANRLDVEAAAREFELPREAVVEALDYAARYGALIEEEAAEERRRAQSIAAAPSR